MVNEESRRFRIGPGVQGPKQKAGCQQESPLHVATSPWGLAPSCFLAGLSLLHTAQAQPGAHPCLCGAILAATQRLDERKGPSGRADGRTAGSGCTGCALQNSRRGHFHPSLAAMSLEKAPAASRPSVSRSTWSEESRGRDGVRDRGGRAEGSDLTAGGQVEQVSG